MRVLLVNDLPLGPGSGTEVHVERLARALADAGDDVDVFAGEVVHRGVAKVLDVWDPWARRALARRAASFRPDVVHYHHVVRELSASVLGVPRTAGCVLTCHDWRLLRAREGSTRDPLLYAKWAKGVLDRAVVRQRVDAVVAVEPTLADALRAAGLRRVHVVPTFADPEPPTPVGDDVVYAGRLSPEKGVDVLIEGFGRVAAQHAGVRLRIGGAGPELDHLQRFADAAAPGRVRFEGLLEEPGVRALLREARVVCLASRVAEGAPLLAIEAMLCGRPVIATESPAASFLVGPDRGFVVPRANVDALAWAIDRLLGDRELAQRMGDAARARADEVHTPAAAVTALHAVYEEAVNRARARARR